MHRHDRLHGLILPNSLGAPQPKRHKAARLRGVIDDMLAEQVCRPAWARLGLLARPLPVAVPPVPVILTWHHRNDTDPGHAWLRHQVRPAPRAILDASGSVGE